MLLAQLCVGRIILWGDSKSVGVGWVANGKNSTSINQIREKDTRKIVFQTSAESSYAEWGWQWAPWSPNFRGTDFRSFNTLDVEFRLLGPRPPSDVSISLASPGDHRTTERLSIKSAINVIPIGKWCCIKMPLDKFPNPAGRYDAEHTIQLIFGTWNGKGGKFSFEVRKIAIRH